MAVKLDHLLPQASTNPGLVSSAGVAAGTPAYMAPEMFVHNPCMQYTVGSADHDSETLCARLRKSQSFSPPDVHSFGVILWSMWTM